MQFNDILFKESGDTSFENIAVFEVFASVRRCQ